MTPDEVLQLVVEEQSQNRVTQPKLADKASVRRGEA